MRAVAAMAAVAAMDGAMAAVAAAAMRSAAVAAACVVPTDEEACTYGGVTLVAREVYQWRSTKY